jgi:DNA-directed RNA polymerase specialized sigma24 family protein
MSRSEKVALVRQLRDNEGLIWGEIGSRLGISRSTAHSLYHDPTREKEKVRKARYNGSCVDCGASTRYGSSGPYERCDRCSRMREAERRRAERDARGRQMIEMRRGGLLNYEIAQRLGCSPEAVANLLYRMARDGYDVPRSPYYTGRQRVAA